MDAITIRTSVKHGLKRFLMIRGAILALIGVALLLYSGVFVPVDTLANWGLPIFLTSIFFICWGMIPYKRVVKLETSPNAITVTDKGELHYIRHGKDIATYRISDIEKVEYVEQKGVYGIGIEFRKEMPKKAISVIGQMFRSKYDLFLPYFSERGYEELSATLPTS